MIWKVLEYLLRAEENIKKTWRAIREESATEKPDSNGFGTPQYRGVTGAGWAHTLDGNGNVIYVPGDLVDEFVDAEHEDLAETQEIGEFKYGPFSPMQMRAIIGFARTEPDPDIVMIWVAAHGGTNDLYGHGD